MESGSHPPTRNFPLVVDGAIMIEPVKTESQYQLDRFIEAIGAVAREAGETPELVRNAPARCEVKRLDDIGAARHPCLPK